MLPIGKYSAVLPIEMRRTTECSVFGGLAVFLAFGGVLRVPLAHGLDHGYQGWAE